MRRFLSALAPLAFCLAAACSTEVGADAGEPVESDDANLDYRATNGMEFDVAGQATITLAGADAELTGDARSAKLEELARAKIDAITRALDAELMRLWPEERRQHEKNIVAMVRMSTPGRGDFRVEGPNAAFDYWAQVAGPTNLLETLPLEREGDKKVSKLTVDDAPVVLTWAPAATTADAYPAYAEMFEDGLDIAIHVGGDHYTPRNDMNESEAIFAELSTLGLRPPVASFAELGLDSGPFVGSLDVAGDRRIEVRATLVHADMAPDDRLDLLVQKFKDMAKTADVVIYRGHAGTQLDYSGVVVHYDPRVAIPASEFKSLDLPSKYQLFVFDGCETYTGYADKLLEHPGKDAKNADVITSVNYGSALVRAESVRALLHGLLDKTGTTSPRWIPRSFDALLKKVNDTQRGPWTSIYGVHGLSDNPRVSMLADPAKIGTTCRVNADCGAPDSLCVTTSAGKVCGAACTDDSGCPDGVKCSPVTSRTLGAIKQCLPPRR